MEDTKNNERCVIDPEETWEDEMAEFYATRYFAEKEQNGRPQQNIQARTRQTHE